jgi:hypothetical protein
MNQNTYRSCVIALLIVITILFLILTLVLVRVAIIVFEETKKVNSLISNIKTTFSDLKDIIPAIRKVIVKH